MFLKSAPNTWDPSVRALGGRLVRVPARVVQLQWWDATITSAPTRVRNFLVLVQWALCHVTCCVFSAICRYGYYVYFISFWCFFMHWAGICWYCICYEQLRFPLTREAIFCTYEVNTNVDFGFWWLSIGSLNKALKWRLPTWLDRTRRCNCKSSSVVPSRRDYPYVFDSFSIVDMNSLLV